MALDRLAIGVALFLDHVVLVQVPENAGLGDDGRIGQDPAVTAYAYFWHLAVIAGAAAGRLLSGQNRRRTFRRSKFDYEPHLPRADQGSAGR